MRVKVYKDQGHRKPWVVLGILRMRERSLLLGGEFTISDDPASGATVRSEFHSLIRSIVATPMIRVLIADDHAILRPGLRERLVV